MKTIRQPIHIIHKSLAIGLILIFSVLGARSQNLSTDYNTNEINPPTNDSYNTLLNVYPNPAADEARLVFTSSKYNVPYQVRIIDNAGIVLINIKGSSIQGQNTVTFHIGNYPAGVYYIQLLTSSGRQTLKLLKQRLGNF